MKQNIYFAQFCMEPPPGTQKEYLYFPLSVGCIWSYAQTDRDVRENFLAKEFLVRKEDPDEIVRQLESPKVFAFSSYVWNHYYNLLVARKVKEKYPDCVVVFGGPNVPTRHGNSFLQDNPFVDFAVHNEGEISFQNLLLHLLGKSSDLTGIGGQIIGNPLRPSKRIDDLCVMPSPYTMGLFDPLIEKYRNTNVILNAVIETNRGCPFSCTFCDWGNGALGKVKKFDLTRVKEEIEWVGRNQIEFISGGDANFGAFRDRDMEIAKFVVETKKKYGFPKFFQMNWHKNQSPAIAEIADVLMNGNVMRRFSTSFQTLTEDSLTAIKRKNISMPVFRKIVDAAAKKNIPVVGDLMVPLPGDTAVDFRRTVDFMFDLGVHPQLNHTSILVNAEMADPEYQKKYGMRTVEKPMGKGYLALEKEVLLVGTDTMPPKDFAKIVPLTFAVDFFHLYGFTDLIQRYYKKKHNIKLTEFYDKLCDFFMHNDLYTSKYFSHYKDYSKNPESTSFNAYGIGLLPIMDDLGANNRELFFNDLKQFIKKCLPADENVNVLVSLQYNWQNYENSESEIKMVMKNNLYDYIQSDIPLLDQNTTYTIVSKHIDSVKDKKFSEMLLALHYNKQWKNKISKVA